MLTKRSRNSYILSPRSVTVAPTFIPSRSLKAAIDFFALVTIGLCPEIVIKSLTAESMILAFWIASPNPMLMTIFSSFGTLIGFLKPNSLASAGAISFTYFSLSLAAITSDLNRLAQSHVDDDLLQLRDAHRVLKAELLGERRSDLLHIFFFKSCSHNFRSESPRPIPC